MAALALASLGATMTSTPEATSSFMMSGRRSAFPSTCRASTATVCPSTQPRSRSACRKASYMGVTAGAAAIQITVTRGTLAACCASVTSGTPKMARAENVPSARIRMVARLLSLRA